MIELPSALAKSGAHHPIEPYHTLRDSVSCLSHTATPPEGHQIGVRKRRAPGNTTLSQLYRRRVSIERMHREGSQLAASLESKPGPTPAGKTLPYSYPEKTVFGGRGHDCIPQNFSNVHGCSKHTVIYSLVVGNFKQELRVLGDISVRKKTKE